MKALMKMGRGSAGVRFVEIAEPSPAAGICGTDVHIMRDEYDITPPMVMGHEYSGTVVQVGLFGQKVPFDQDLALKKEITVTNGFTLSDWREGFDAFMGKDVLKVLLVP